MKGEWGLVTRLAKWPACGELVCTLSNCTNECAGTGLVSARHGPQSTMFIVNWLDLRSSYRDADREAQHAATGLVAKVI